MTPIRTLALAAGCTAAGALGAGAVGTGAFSDHHRDGLRHHGLGGLGRAVHAEVVVPRRDDTFATVTFDRGKVVSLSGRELQVREGTRDATYETVTLTIPEDAVIRIKDGDRDPDQLSDLQAGDKVAVWQSSRKTVVTGRTGRDGF